MSITIKDVAKEAGVSITTVSLVLNKPNNSISDKTKQKVIQAAKKLNYVPNKIARSLVNKKTYLIALVVPNLTNPFYPEIAKHVSSVASELSYNVVLLNYDNTKLNNRSLELFENNLVDGALIVTRGINKISEIDKRDKGIKLVFLDEPQSFDIGESYVVTGDNYYGGYIVAEHFIKNGHRNIACITGPKYTPNSSSRLKGFLECCKENNIEIVSDNILEGNYKFDDGYEAALKLVKKDITAVFCFNDLSAYGAVKAFKENGIKVPDEIAVIGYDNLDMTRFVEPPLSSVDQFVTKIAHSATDMLIKLIENIEVEEKLILIKPTLVLRDTSNEKLNNN